MPFCLISVKTPQDREAERDNRDREQIIAYNDGAVPEAEPAPAKEAQGAQQMTELEKLKAWVSFDLEFITSLKKTPAKDAPAK